MAGETRIIAFDASSAKAPEEEILLTDEAAENPAPEPVDSSWDDPEPVEPSSFRWVLPALGIVLLLGWTGYFGWAVSDRLTPRLAPTEAIALIRDWAVPVLLIAVAALVLLRNSRREALRFGEAARVLSQESALLEVRLSTVNRELSLAREFIAAQSRDLETLGRLAADRLSTEADRLQGLIHDNHARVETIGSVSSAALDNMEKLRGQLPVIASSAKDVTNNIGNAGRTAHGQLQEMINGFKKLNEFGQASERQVHVLRGLVDETMSEFSQQADQFANVTAARFSEFRERGAEFRTQLDSHEVEALAAIRTRASAMAEELEQTRQRLDGEEAESLTSMRARLTALRDEGHAIARALREGESRALEGWEASVVRMREELNGALTELQQAEIDAIEARQARTGAIREELDKLEAQTLDQASRFAAELERRQAETTAAEEAAVARLREHLAALEFIAASSRERHGEIDAAAAADLQERVAALDTEIAERRARQQELEAQAADRLRESLAVIDAEMAERITRQEEHGATILAQGQTIVQQLSEFESRTAEIVTHGEAAQASLGASLTTLATRLGESRSALSGTDRDIAALTDSSVRLLELIQASVKHSREELPRVLGGGEEQLSGLEARMTALREAAKETDAHGTHIAKAIETANGHLQQTYAELSQLQSQLEQAGALHGETLTTLREQLDAIAGQSTQLAHQTRAQLALALDTLSASTQKAIAGFGESGASTVSTLARQLGSESAAAIEQAMRTSAEETTGQLERAVAQAAAAGRDAAIQLRDQLSKVNDLAANLESRVAHARQRAEEQVDNDFTRRVALITESLNSNSIDIAKALSTDVADTAWTAYLRGDRGIFTRRAVSLIDNVEAKAIVQIYERDREFHDHVSRYIHDFEAMLRQVLSARDGQAMGVTLLSSDMGKLYVTLAQAIERLRS
ncbi:ATPase [Novosphingobium sp. JCM 18896]|uniref:ATPase n=1 Tax=Novosphingobium sp. JCM 18896 TaxID=2989731 RepID=UPI0022220D05|nr:ATPase [Novosphingobium sp. JCM 18896]MCW1428524.1 ATPase [Novosphingobium sp. JCM 18896]